MSTYHQIGHHSKKLIFENYLSNYHGAILSPVNYTKSEVIIIINEIREKFSEFDIVFDPQLYYPRSQREILRNWTYFPNNVDTIDLSNFQWWQDLILDVSTTVKEINPTTICTPVIYPRVFNNEYYTLMNQISCELCNLLIATEVRVLQTALVSLSDLANFNYVMTLASILTRTSADGIYLIFYSDSNPRREISNPEELNGGMLLINTLQNNQIDVLVGYTSSDIILWKESGAKACATGKFFNLRRFTPSRWAETEDGGGGQLSYLFEENLLAYLRESDVKRVQRAGLFSQSTLENPYFSEIIDNIDKGIPWLGLSWRFYLYWFCDIENKIGNKTINPVNLLRKADENWGIAEDNNVILEERRNNGDWVRQWLRAILEYKQAW